MFPRRLLPMLALALLVTPSARCPAGDDAGPLVRSLWLVQRFGSAECRGPWERSEGQGDALEGPGQAGHPYRDGGTRSHGFLDVREAGRRRRENRRRRGTEGSGRRPPRVSQARSEPEGRGPRRPADDLVRHDRRARTGRPARNSVGLDRRELQAGPSRSTPPWFARATADGASSGRRWGTWPPRTTGCPRSGSTAAARPRPPSTPRTDRLPQGDRRSTIEPTGGEAPRGVPDTANPIYKVRWGQGGRACLFGDDGVLQDLLRSPANPQEGFAALLVCGEADDACPFVKGAALRVSMPYLDPKIYDDGKFEAAKYAERRDDVGRLMLSVMMQARNRLVPSLNTTH